MQIFFEKQLQYEILPQIFPVTLGLISQIYALIGKYYEKSPCLPFFVAEENAKLYSLLQASTFPAELNQFEIPGKARRICFAPPPLELFFVLPYPK